MCGVANVFKGLIRSGCKDYLTNIISNEWQMMKLVFKNRYYLIELISNER